MPIFLEKAVVKIADQLVQLSPRFLALVRLFASWGMDTSVTILPDYLIVSGAPIYGAADVTDRMRGLVEVDELNRIIRYKSVDGWLTAPLGSFIGIHVLSPLRARKRVAFVLPEWRDVVTYNPVRGHYTTRPIAAALVAGGRTEVLTELSVDASNLWEEDDVWYFQTARGVEEIGRDDMVVLVRFWEDEHTLEGFVVKAPCDLIPALTERSAELRLPQGATV